MTVTSIWGGTSVVSIIAVCVYLRFIARLGALALYDDVVRQFVSCNLIAHKKRFSSRR